MASKFSVENCIVFPNSVDSNDSMVVGARVVASVVTGSSVVITGDVGFSVVTIDSVPVVEISVTEAGGFVVSGVSDEA